MLALLLEAFGEWNIPLRVTDDIGYHPKPQPATEKSSQNIAKRWRMDETRARMRSAHFEFLNTRCKTGVKQTRTEEPGYRTLLWISSSGYSYIKLACTRFFTVLSHKYGVCKKRILFFFYFSYTFFSFIYTIE